MSALGRLRDDAENVVRILSAGRDALPRLAMGSDDEAMVHVGVNDLGDVVRLDLDAGWREAVPAEALGTAVTQALQNASQVRVGDWAAAVLAADPPSGRGRTTSVDDSEPAPEASAPAPPVWLDINDGTVQISPEWVLDVDDATVQTRVLQALTWPSPRTPSVGGPVRLAEVRELKQRTHRSLHRGAAILPGFLRGAVQQNLDRVHDDLDEALSLSVVGEAKAAAALRGFASDLDYCDALARRPAAMPEASGVWADAAVRLASGLAQTRSARRPGLGRFRRRTGLAS